MWLLEVVFLVHVVLGPSFVKRILIVLIIHSESLVTTLVIPASLLAFIAHTLADGIVGVCSVVFTHHRVQVGIEALPSGSLVVDLISPSILLVILAAVLLVATSTR